MFSEKIVVRDLNMSGCQCVISKGTESDTALRVTWGELKRCEEDLIEVDEFMLGSQPKLQFLEDLQTEVTLVYCKHLRRVSVGC